MSENRWSLVVAVGLAVFMAQVDASIVNVALPTIQRDFGVHPDFSQWVILGYLLPVVALVVPAGRWLDTVGKRAVLTFSVAGFAVASAAAGAAPGISWLIAARAVQGGFGALLVAQLPVLATTAVRPQARGRAMGIVATLGPLGAVSGPALGGALLAVAGWPAIFFVNVPVALAVIAVGLRSLPSDGPLRIPDRGLAAEFALLGGAGTVALLALSLAPARPA
jgi:MFS family permease